MARALMKAVSSGRQTQIKLLLASGCHLEMRDSEGQTPLIRALLLDQRTTRQKIVMLLLRAGSRVSSVDARERSALMWGCIQNRDREVDWMLKYADLDLNLNQTDADGRTALAFAVVSGNVVTVRLMVRVLLQQGLSVEIPDTEGITPLMYAIMTRNHNCASLLIHQGGATVGRRMTGPRDVANALKSCQNEHNDDKAHRAKSESSNKTFSSHHIPLLRDRYGRNRKQRDRWCDVSTTSASLHALTLTSKASLLSGSDIPSSSVRTNNRPDTNPCPRVFRPSTDLHLMYELQEQELSLSFRISIKRAATKLDEEKSTDEICSSGSSGSEIIDNGRDSQDSTSPEVYVVSRRTSSYPSCRKRTSNCSTEVASSSDSDRT